MKRVIKEDKEELGKWKEGCFKGRNRRREEDEQRIKDMIGKY